MTATTALSPIQIAVNDLARHFAVIPIVAGGKRAAVEWKPFQTRRPAPGELTAWFAGENRNLALVCGAISGGLAVLDIDDPALADRIADDIALQTETTLVRTPRGGVHIYSIEVDAISRGGPIVPGVADLQAEGRYVLTPPSVVGGREYTTQTNTTILPVANARVWALDLLRAYNVVLPMEGAAARLPDAQEAAGGIPSGQRNSTLISLAGSMRRRDMSEEAITAALLKENAAKCRPPPPEVEVRAIATSASKYEAGERTFPRTDAGNGEIFARLHGDRLRYDHRRTREDKYYTVARRVLQL